MSRVFDRSKEVNLNSSFEVLDGRDDLLYLASYRCGIVLHQLGGWLGDKGRRVRRPSAWNSRIPFYALGESASGDSARFRAGEKLSVFQADGQHKRFKIHFSRDLGLANRYLVRDLDDLTLYCLKESSAIAVDRPENVRKLYSEAAISLLLGNHPNIIRTISVFELRGRLMIQTECDAETGKSLEALAENGVSLARALEFAIQICRAMSHARRVLPDFTHGGITLRNCFVTSEEVLKIGGFESASANVEGVSSSLTAKAEQRESTSGFTATDKDPSNQDSGSMRPDRSLDERRDLISFGATLLELIAGRSPFGSRKAADSDSGRDVSRHHLGILSEKGAPTELVDLIGRCLKGEPGQESDVFRELEKKLAAILKRISDREIPEFTVSLTSEEEFVERARSLALVGCIDEAAKCIDSAMETFGASAELYAVRAIVTCCGPRVDDAVEASAEALKLGSDRFIVLLARAKVLLAQGKLNAAEKFLERALELKPYNCVALNLLGKVFLKKGNLREAWICFDQSMAIDNSQIEPLEGLATIDLRTGNEKKAIRKAKRAVRLDPHRAILHRLLGDAYAARDRTAEAVNAYKEAILTGKADRNASRAFMDACRRLYRVGGRRMHYRQLRTLVEGTRLLGRERIENAEAGKFARRLVSVIGKDSHDIEFVFFFDAVIGKIASRLDRPVAEELELLLLSGRDLSADRQHEEYLLDSIGKCHFHLGNLRECRAVLERRIAMFGPNETSSRYIAACLEMEGDLRECLKFYKKARKFSDCESTRANIDRVRSKLRDVTRTPQNVSSIRNWQGQTPLL